MSYESELIAQGLCPEVVPILTEDGPATGRCLAPIADFEVGACEGHAAEIRGWHAMSEAEKAVAKARDEGRAEAQEASARKLAAIEFRYAAAGRLADPAAALDLLDVSKFLGDDGEPDPRRIEAAIDRLAGPRPDPDEEPVNGHAPRVPAGPRQPVPSDGGDFIRGIVGRRRG